MPLSNDDTTALARRLLAEHGELIGGKALARCLGYRTQRAFQMGIQRGRINLETFTLTGRRGWYARTFQVAQWLAACGPDPAGLDAGTTEVLPDSAKGPAA